MEARMNKRGDIFQDSGLFDGVDEDPILEEVATSEETVDSSGNNTTVSEETVAEEVVTSADEVIPSSSTISTSKPVYCCLICPKQKPVQGRGRKENKTESQVQFD